MVSLYETGELQPDALAQLELPKPLRKMTDKERIAFLSDMQAMRQEIREQIRSLSEARRQFLAEHRVDQKIEDSRLFDSVIRRTIRDKAEEIGYSFPDR
jgi:hypothetical protein